MIRLSYMDKDKMLDIKECLDEAYSSHIEIEQWIANKIFEQMLLRGDGSNDNIEGTIEYDG